MFLEADCTALIRSTGKDNGWYLAAPEIAFKVQYKICSRSRKKMASACAVFFSQNTHVALWTVRALNFN